MSNHRKGEEYPPKSGIIITSKTNPSGTKAYRVDIAASITGSCREQRQFSAKDEAQAYAKQRRDEITKFGHEAFALTAAQRHDAKRALALLSPYSISLEDAALIAMRQLPKAQERINVTTLRGLFLKAPGKRKSQLTPRRPHTMQGLKWRTAKFEAAFSEHDAASIGTAQVKTWLGSLGEMSPVSLNNHRRALHAMFSFAVSEGFCATNPVTKVPLFHVVEKAPTILSVDQAARLVFAAAQTESTHGLLGYVILGLFAGLRRAELERLDWSAVKWERRMVTVDGSIAKTGSIRNVALAPNALAWLAACPIKAGKVTPPNLNRRLRELRQLAGIEVWHGNELRHSFASYHFDLHQNAPLTAAMLGHNSGTQLLFEHYRSLVPLGDGERFFAIQPHAVASVPADQAAMPA